MKLTGDEKGIEVLKGFHNTKPEYLKFLLKEAQTSFDLTSHFSGDNGEAYKLVLDAKTGEFTIIKA